MANRYVRLYEGREPGTTVIGGSASASGAIYDKRVQSLLTDLGYEIKVLPENVKDLGPDAIIDDLMAYIPEGSRSCFHLEVQPPLSPVHTQALGKLLMGGAIVDPYHNEAMLIDHRPDSPTFNTVVARW